MTQFIRIIGWEKHQHYKDRNPPWIKLHRELLTSETWVSSSDQDRVLAVAIMLLAADTGNRIPANPRFIQRRAYLDHLPDLSGLIALNFIEIIEENDDASSTLASARPETETETDIPLANANGAKPDPEKDFWDAAKAHLKPKVKGDPGALIGKWLRERGKEMTMAALNASQIERSVDPPAYIEGYFRRQCGSMPAGKLPI